MADTSTKRPRRSHWQALAARRYRRMRWLAGDGPWLSLSRCGDDWKYRLFDDQMMAEIESRKPCGPHCRGNQLHRCWRLLEKPKEPQPSPLAGLKLALPNDIGPLFWD